METSLATNLEEDVEQPHRPAGPCVMVICGAAGDLTARKLIPSLFNLAKAQLLPSNFAVLGLSRDEFDADQ